MHNFRFPVGRLVKLASALLAFGALGVGCSSEGETRCGGVEIDGVCYAACSDSECVEGNRCIADLVTKVPACRPPCGTQDDCETGTNCVGINFSDGSQAPHCLPLLGGKTGQGDACTTVDECDFRRGYECVANVCEKLCTDNSECAEGELCATDESLVKDTPTGYCKAGPCTTNRDCDIRPGYHCIDSECVQAECVEHGNCAGGVCTTGGQDSDGNTVNYCAPAPDEKRGPGQYGSACPGGPTDCAEGFVCIRAGEGDLYSYCTELDCTQDSDCGTGFHCGRRRVADAPCTDICPNVPGEAGPGCVADDAIGAGKQYECGALNLLRNSCIKNTFCAPCETHEDCLGEPGQICAMGPDGTKSCTVACDPMLDSCPWGNANECKVFDTELGFATCGHRFGACNGTGQGCEPCVDDDSCGPDGVCIGSQFTGERFCLDLATECSCEGLDDSAVPGTCLGGGCPTTPDGTPMLCVRETATPSVVSNRCFGANTNTGPFTSPQQGCWRAP